VGAGSSLVLRSQVPILSADEKNKFQEKQFLVVGSQFSVMGLHQ
jgi:hypothetical protein